jgi:hypothetical protein
MTLNLRAFWLLGFALAIGCSWINEARAQTMVLACPGWWGVSGGLSSSCTGCSAPIWSAPDAADEVKTDASQYWAKLGSLPATANVVVGTGKTEGASATCSDTSGTKTAGDLLGAASPSPPVNPTPAPGTGSVTLNWGAPATNTDGTALTNLAGYRVLYGQSADALSNTVAIANPTTLSTVITGPSGGTWYFAVKSFNTAGVEGPLSNIVSATVDASAPSPTPIPTPTPSPTPPPAPAPLWVVVANGTSTTRPVYEAVLPISGIGLVRGNQDGSIAVGKPCGAELFKQSTNSYRAIANTDAQLASPTYGVRQHVAVCVQRTAP